MGSWGRSGSSAAPSISQRSRRDFLWPWEGACGRTDISASGWDTCPNNARWEATPFPADSFPTLEETPINLPNFSRMGQTPPKGKSTSLLAPFYPKAEQTRSQDLPKGGARAESFASQNSRGERESGHLGSSHLGSICPRRARPSRSSVARRLDRPAVLRHRLLQRCFPGPGSRHLDRLRRGYWPELHHLRG